MNPKPFLWLLTAILLALVHRAEAQQPKKIPRIGYIATAGDITNPGPVVVAFQQGMRDLGYIEGKNITVVYRYPGSEPKGRPTSVSELIRLNLDVLVTSSTAAIRAAKQANTTTPMVMVATFDPVQAGVAESLARPGTNFTGVLRLTHQLSGKRLELFKEAVPHLSRVGIIAERTSAHEYGSVAQALKVSLDPIDPTRSQLDLESVFHAALSGASTESLLSLAAASIVTRRKSSSLRLKTNYPPCSRSVLGSMPEDLCRIRLTIWRYFAVPLFTSTKS